ncbi:MAG: DNA recombination protein RmuC [Candidatus Latescibacteria bacterium]|nr:DNA recombination protein RmuC [Candidatus Latescibacterota bacterium]
MNYLLIFVSLFVGICIGFGISFFLRIIQGKSAREIAAELYHENELLRIAERDAVIENVKSSFGNLSLEALNKATDHVIKLTEGKFKSEREIQSKELDSKKGLIDQQLIRITFELDKVSKLMNDLEKDREKKFGELSRHLEDTGKRTTDLIHTTNSLREALAHTKTRGQWGERMAEDILSLAGFMENINFVKQKSSGDSGNIPDFTFLLPRDLTLNMDVKFPLDNYMRYLDAENEIDKENYRKSFLKDVRGRIQEVTTRDYINPSQNTVDYMLLFIPNEQIYGFIQEQDRSIVDDGLKKHVIVCSPLTLFAVLAIIRAAIDNFALEKTSNKILSLLGGFKNQWDKFVISLEKVGKHIETTQKEYERLITTRRRQLEKPLNKIDELRTHRGLPEVYMDDNDPLLIDDDHNVDDNDE